MKSLFVGIKNVFVFILSIAATVVYAVFLTSSIFHWVRCRFWTPRPFHVLSVVILFIGLLQMYIYHSSFMETAVIYPLLPYIIFVMAGGGLYAKDIPLNRLLHIDRMLDKREMIPLLKEKLSPYKSWTYENLLSLTFENYMLNSGYKDIPCLNFVSQNGKKYEFSLDVYEMSECNPDVEEYDLNSDLNPIMISGILRNMDKRFYKPQCKASFIMYNNGEIIKDGIADKNLTN